VAGTLEGFLDNMSNIPAPPVFRSTYRDFFNHILLKFPEGLTESATGLVLDERCVKSNGDIISACRRRSHEGIHTELSSGVGSVERGEGSG